MKIEKQQTIESVTIRRRKRYEDNPGRFVGEVEYEGSGNKVAIMLDQALSEKLLEYLAPVLVEYSRRVALQIADDITQQVAALSTPAIEATTEQADDAA